MTVAFRAYMVGTRDGILEVRSDAQGNPHRVALSGTGCALLSVARSRQRQLSCGP